MVILHARYFGFVDVRFCEFFFFFFFKYFTAVVRRSDKTRNERFGVVVKVKEKIVNEL